MVKADSHVARDHSTRKTHMPHQPRGPEGGFDTGVQ